jgi:dienelactone hydrolase
MSHGSKEAPTAATAVILSSSSVEETRPTFIPECHLLDVEPAVLAMIPSERPESCTYRGPRLIKTEQFAQVLQAEWREECYTGRTGPTGADDLKKTSSMGRPHLFTESSRGTTYYGHVVYPPNVHSSEVLPVLVVFQTGAGPHDLYFRWKADAWARGIHTGQTGHIHQRCIVFIADMLSDERGWGWDNNKSRYQTERLALFQTDASTGMRPKLRQHLNLVMDTVKKLQHADPTSLCAFCFCMGGHAALELVRMRIPGIKAVSVFHGVFDGICSSALLSKDGAPLEVSLNQGEDDPYVPKEELNHFTSQLEMQPQVSWKLHHYPGVVHGFTNPSHEFHPSPNFDYAEKATVQSMTEALAMFRRTCCSNTSV